MEEGLPLTEAERESMPDADTVWLTPLQEMLTCLERVGLVVRWQDDCSRSHRVVADSLIDAFAANATQIAERIGRRALDELLAAHRLWSDWLRDGWVRKIAFVAEKTEMPRTRDLLTAAELCDHSPMRVIVSDSAADLIEQQGGRVYVWLKRARCCGSVTTLATSSEPPRRKVFQRAQANDGFDLYLDARLSRLPDELQFDVRRFPRRLEAYWNGCAWVI